MNNKQISVLMWFFASLARVASVCVILPVNGQSSPSVAISSALLVQRKWRRMLECKGREWNVHSVDVKDRLLSCSSKRKSNN